MLGGVESYKDGTGSVGRRVDAMQRPTARLIFARKSMQQMLRSGSGIVQKKRDAMGI